MIGRETFELEPCSVIGWPRDNSDRAVIGRESLVSETGFVIGRSRLLTFLVFLVSPVRLVACDFSLGFSEFKVLDLWFELASADKLLLTHGATTLPRQGTSTSGGAPTTSVCQVQAS